MAKKLHHAEHNKMLCEKINAEKIHNDWCITTAFYSALHFVDLKILPFEISATITCQNLKEASFHLRTKSKHETREEMVKIQCNKIYDTYRWLADNAHDARYKTYKFTPTQADKALQFLKEIEEYCTA